jgi:hypothetical protein
MRTDRTPVETQPTTRLKLTAERPSILLQRSRPVALWSTSVVWEAPQLRKSLFFGHVPRDPAVFRGGPKQMDVRSRNAAPVHPARLARVATAICLGCQPRARSEPLLREFLLPIPI